MNFKLNFILFVIALIAIVFGIVTGIFFTETRNYATHTNEYVCTQIELVKERPACVQYSIRARGE